MPITVCIVDDNSDIRQALEQIVQLSDDFSLVGSFTNGEEALVNIPQLQPNVVLMDINLGGISGIECVRRLKPANQQVSFMMCTVYEDDEKIFEALSAGASGYILKKTPPAKLLDAIRELNEGGAPMTSLIARKVVAAFQQPAQAAAGKNTFNQASLSTLSNREMEILEQLSKGLLYKEIAAQLFISQETVRKHVYHIYEKLHVNNRIEAVNRYFGR
ncbi:MAG: response regulator transcription factor [Flavihumibacter sp.]